MLKMFEELSINKALQKCRDWLLIFSDKLDESFRIVFDESAAVVGDREWRNCNPLLVETAVGTKNPDDRHYGQSSIRDRARQVRKRQIA